MPSSLRRRLLVAVTAVATAAALAACDTAIASPNPNHPSAYRPSARPTSTGHHHGGGATTTAAATTTTGATDPTQDPTGSADPTEDPTGSADPTQDPSGSADPTTSAAATTTAAGGGGTINGLDVLARDCTGSTLTPHTGFQIAPACVSTEFGEVSDAAHNPSLLITKAPTEVGAGQPFSLSVSTRNLVRDRFLGAAAGGYYLESSLLDDKGLQRGHFHTACRMLASTEVAPDAAPVPDFFLATQDGGGGDTPDTVEVAVTKGMPTKGTAQCTVWAGDGSHRVPMMQRANQTPAVDSVRITIT